MKTARIAVLAVALAAGGGAIWVMNGPKPSLPELVVQLPKSVDMDDVLVAARELPMGTLVAETDLLWQTWPKSAVSPGMIRREENPKIVDDLKGSVSRATFFQGEPMRREKLVKGPNSGFMSAILPSGLRAVAINIDAQGATTAGGFILPNDRVDVIRTYREDSRPGASETFISETVLSNIRVLAIGQNVQEKNGERVVVGSNATLELDQHQAEVIVQAQRVGQLSLTLRSMLDANKVPEGDPNRGSLTVVRFGIPVESRRQ